MNLWLTVHKAKLEARDNTNENEEGTRKLAANIADQQESLEELVENIDSIAEEIKVIRVQLRLLSVPLVELPIIVDFQELEASAKTQTFISSSSGSASSSSSSTIGFGFGATSVGFGFNNTYNTNDYFNNMKATTSSSAPITTSTANPPVMQVSVHPCDVVNIL